MAQTCASQHVCGVALECSFLTPTGAQTSVFEVCGFRAKTAKSADLNTAAPRYVLSYTQNSLVKSDEMLLSEFDYNLPRELIASRPLPKRDSSRMMVLNRAAQSCEDREFSDLPQILEPTDLLVLNNTKVFPARLLGRRRGIAAQAVGKNNPRAREFLTSEVELLLTHCEGGNIWQGLVHPGRKVPTGEVLVFGDGELKAEILGRGPRGVRRVRLRSYRGTVATQIEKLGHVPLPPYLGRPDEEGDRRAYQTVYAKVPGAVAAPTAGLHFTPRVFKALRERGIETCELTLHVGPGTFRPVRAERIEEHQMENERYAVPSETAEAIQRALNENRRVVAVGTTCTRALEAIALREGGKITASYAETDLFITPGFQFRVTRGLLTNFHLPRSTLLMLVCAFAGRDLTFQAYRRAVRKRYRFYSYGDCMLIL
ncbi:MAG: tRNA preQ1(34) S-adenosylmethionine ribosyltransferase-isomerase QueA [Terriglobia bacterium]